MPALGYVSALELPTMVLVFFGYALLGFVMECIVLTLEKKRLVMDRGFTRHLPFCIIYGFGAMAGYAVLQPVRHNMVLLFVLGALLATGFEFFVGKLQLRLFGSFWWDYTEKPLNYKGIICPESTVGWGVLAVVVVRYVHQGVVGVVAALPQQLAALLALALVCGYLLDFVISARMSRRQGDVAAEAGQNEGAWHPFENSQTEKHF